MRSNIISLLISTLGILSCSRQTASEARPVYYLPSVKTAACAGLELDSASVNYNTDVQPIIAKYCLSCHAAGAQAPNISTYQTLTNAASMVSTAIVTNAMPPSGSTAVSAADRAIYTAWVGAGMPETAAAAAAAAPAVTTPGTTSAPAAAAAPGAAPAAVAAAAGESAGSTAAAAAGASATCTNANAAPPAPPPAPAPSAAPTAPAPASPGSPATSPVVSNSAGTGPVVYGNTRFISTVGAMFSGSATYNCLYGPDTDLVAAAGNGGFIADCYAGLSPVGTWNLVGTTLVNGNGQCMDTVGKATTVGTLMTLAPCDGTASQNWTIAATMAAAGTIKQVSSGLCLELGTAPGVTPVQLATCNGNSSQNYTRADSVFTGPSRFTLLFAPAGLISLVAQSDGNLVIYFGRSFVWATNSNGIGTAPYTAGVDNTGNLMMYQSNGNSIYSSHSTSGTPPYTFSLADSGLITITDSKKVVVWKNNPVIPGTNNN